MNILLALSCLALLGVIAAQDWLYPPLRNETISAGLTGRYHVALDVAYVPLAIALSFSFHGLMQALGIISGVALILVAVTNTAWRWCDLLTDGKHALWHSRFTLTVFVTAILLQTAGDHGAWWYLTAANIAIPGAIYGYFHYRTTIIEGVSIAASPAAEKAFVAFLCLWLILWGL